MLWEWMITGKHNEGQIPFFEYDSETAAPKLMRSIKELHVFFCILTSSSVEIFYVHQSQLIVLLDYKVVHLYQ